ncbi:hypothetical protein BDQ94DRAFT_141646 [Aspergillus welwitschiae]|uniref:Uncharacterized protein n=1 Tax=Aspergillus welwitschiae TaxID=1341132 RepID=A0A3F3Q6Y6_9EURO|nr:hypothetical protein BDQ94DRAFT_141646 [Aspergillus welwitschiae]RDH34516.1 hypothetical protein BDQ94DRAFT_141646 [Aspergillus welwitschiae]
MLLSRVESSHRAGRVHIIHSPPFIRMARGASSHLFFLLCVCVPGTIATTGYLWDVI